MLKHRLITGSILIVALLGLILLDNWMDTVTLRGFWRTLFADREHPPRGLILFIFSLLIVAPLAALELSAIFKAVGIRTRPWLTAAAAMLGLVMSYSIPMGTDTITTVAIVSSGAILMFVASLFTFSRQQTTEGVVAAAGAVMFAMVHLGLMLGFLLALRREHSAWWIVGVIAATKMCDSGAYFTGRAIGKHKMIPWLSPGKTWEGLAGGVLASGLTGLGLAALSGLLAPDDRLGLPAGLLCGVVLGFVGQGGDLLMSLLKRNAGLKDSSTILPGLGGLLDVLDSPLLVAPVAFWMLAAFT